MFERLPGFRDFYPEDCLRRDHLFRRWRQVARSFNFQPYDVPTLEPLELYQAKNEELGDQLFNFTDKGGRAVVLRPELTRSLARMVGAKASSLKRPIKWFNIAENFRYEKPQKGRLRSHYQFNADIFGETDPAADAELMATCLACLRALGLGPNDIVLRLSDRQLWSFFLEGFGFEGDTAAGVMGVVDRLEKWERPAVLERLTSIVGAQAAEVLAAIERFVGVRSLDEVRGALPRRALEGDGGGRLAGRLADWQRLLADLEAQGLGAFVRIDLGIVRGLAYYTGFVYEVFEKAGDGETAGRALAGGGRYDNLIAGLGYQALPAAGFGMGDVTVSDLLEERGLFPSLVAAPDVYQVVGGDAERLVAVADAARLREIGLAVECPHKATGFGKQFKAAGASGARIALIYGSDEVARREVRVKDLRSGGEASLHHPLLIAAVPTILEEGLPPPPSAP